MTLLLKATPVITTTIVDIQSASPAPKSGAKVKFATKATVIQSYYFNDDDQPTFHEMCRRRRLFVNDLPTIWTCTGNLDGHNESHPCKPVPMVMESMPVMGCFYCRRDLSFLPPKPKSN